jgi:hypothetical protein
MLGITVFLDPVYRPICYRTKRFRNCICFCPQMRGGDPSALLDPLEEGNLNHWTNTVSETSCSLEYFTVCRVQSTVILRVIRYRQNPRECAFIVYVRSSRRMIVTRH